MANSNSDNPMVGRKFQYLAKKVLSKEFGISFDEEVEIDIGNPAKSHRFDLANKDRSIVAECKCYTWTDSGNVPSAKLMGLDEALFYFSFLPPETKKILCMVESKNSGKTETLAEYYVRIHGHLLRDVSVYEIIDENTMREISYR